MFNKVVVIGTAVVLTLLIGTVADAAPGLCVTKPPVVGPSNTGPLIDPPARKGQWFANLHTGDEEVRPCEFYDNVYGHGGGWAECDAIEGYVLANIYDPQGRIKAFVLDVYITNDMPGYDRNWRDGDNQHEEYLQTYHQIGEEQEPIMWNVKWTAEFADDGTVGDFPNTGPPYIPAQWPFGWTGSIESIAYARPWFDESGGFDELAWYCWTPDPDNPQQDDGQYMVPTWDFGDIGPGQTVLRTIRFYLYQPLDSTHPLFQWLEEWHEYQYDVLLNRTTSLKISTYFDYLYIDPRPCIPYPHEELDWPWRSSDCSVFFDIEKPEPPKIEDMGRWGGAIEIFWWTGWGFNYGVESSTDPYDQNYDENMMTWTDEVTGIPGIGGIVSWVDPNAPPAIGPEKYYRVFVEDVCGQRYYAADTVGAMSLKCGMNRNMVSSPFEPYPDGGLSGPGTMGIASLDKIVDFQLTGHPVSKWASDQIWAWDPILQTYIGAWLNLIGGQWRDFYTNGLPLFGIESDRGYWFTINNNRVEFVFFGRVSKTDRLMTCLMNRNMLGSCFPIMCWFNECNLVGSGFTGHPVSQWASDKVEFWLSGPQTYYGVWYRIGSGWREWNSMVLPPARDFYPTEGFWITVNNAAFNWTYPVAPRVYSP